MNITTVNKKPTAIKPFGKCTAFSYGFLMLVLISACAAPQSETEPPSGAIFRAIPSTSETATEEKFQAVPIAPKDPKAFAIDVVKSVGSSVGQCGPDAEDSPQIDWTCAEYTQGFEAFKQTWDKRTASNLFKRKHGFSATSDWMYYVIDGEIDFFWRTYELEDTQALVSYDPSETGNELIVGLNWNIGTQFAEAKGSQKYNGETDLLPIQE